MYKRLILFILLSTTTSLFAQKDKRFEKIKAHKVAYITDKLDLTEREAEKFWPVYNRYEKQLHQLIVLEKRALIKKVKNKGGIDKLTDIEAEKIIIQINKNREQIYTIEKEKFDKLKSVLASKKLLKLYVAEKSFKKELFQRLQKQRRKRFKN